MIRTVIKASHAQMTFQVPDSYIGKNIEILAFALDDEESNQLTYNEEATNSLLSVNVLSKDWLTKVEDDAWRNL